MERIIVLAMHGVPPRDFPSDELAEMMSLHARLGHAPENQKAVLGERHHALETRMRDWPRNEWNDPYFAASNVLAAELAKATGDEVVVGFNEFCAPSLDEALDRAAARAPEQVLVITPMMTQGGEHSEKDIPAAIERARTRHPGLSIRYVWPFPVTAIARFLAEQATRAD